MTPEQAAALAGEFLDGMTGIYMPETQSVSVRRLVAPKELAALLLRVADEERDYWRSAIDKAIEDTELDGKNDLVQALATAIRARGKA